MKGKYRVIVSTKRLRYDFELRRNITILCGDSATGKTTLIEMIQEHMDHPTESSVEVICEKACYVLSGALWQQQLAGIQDSIVFIDEGNEFIWTDAFAREIQKTDNYYVIATREGLPALPYSVEEIYGIRTSGKYGTLKQSYHEFYRIYAPELITEPIQPEKIITEDSNSGYQFFQAVSRDLNLKCKAAGGKSNIFHYVNVNEKEMLLIIADGATFGSEIARILHLLKKRKNAALYLPESFEWLILSSGLLKDREVDAVLERPEEYIESKQYFSWERFFTELLSQKTKDTYFAYTKKKLNPAYLTQSSKAKILDEIKMIQLKK